MKLGLERIAQIDELLGNPSAAYPTVHVAGTNGKGSVVTKIAAALANSGKRVGLFTSPHLIEVNERISINGQCITDDELEESLAFFVDKDLSYFEKITLLAFNYFAKKKVDIAVIEVGMGGRLDATNIITPLLSVITSISLDHTQYLGETLEKIAGEKAGIIKPGIPVLIGKETEPRWVFRQVAQEKGSLLYTVEGSFADFEEENKATAAKALSLLHVPLSGLEVVPPARFQRVGKVVLDVAHNRAGIEKLLERTHRTFPGEKITVLATFSQGKEHEKLIEILLAKADKLYLSVVNHPRAILLSALDKYTSFVIPKLEEAFYQAYAQEGILVVCGTFFMMEEIVRILQKVLSSQISQEIFSVFAPMLKQP
ncbi:MAG: bifunctional folylpolyglutamate synthase/dihydrofolate synthase [Chlamydiales bacterium]